MTQGLNPGLTHCRQMLLLLGPLGKSVSKKLFNWFKEIFLNFKNYSFNLKKKSSFLIVFLTTTEGCVLLPHIGSYIFYFLKNL